MPRLDRLLRARHAGMLARRVARGSILARRFRNRTAAGTRTSRRRAVTASRGTRNRSASLHSPKDDPGNSRWYCLGMISKPSMHIRSEHRTRLDRKLCPTHRLPPWRAKSKPRRMQLTTRSPSARQHQNRGQLRSRPLAFLMRHHRRLIQRSVRTALPRRGALSRLYRSSHRGRNCSGGLTSTAIGDARRRAGSRSTKLPNRVRCLNPTAARETQRAILANCKRLQNRPRNAHSTDPDVRAASEVVLPTIGRLPDKPERQVQEAPQADIAPMRWHAFAEDISQEEVTELPAPATLSQPMQSTNRPDSGSCA